MIQDDNGVLRSEDQPVFCRDCAHLIGVRMNTSDWERWQCGAPKNKAGVNLVNGRTNLKYPMCKDQRESKEEFHCGPYGMWYVLYQQPSYQHIADQQSTVAVPTPGITIGGKIPKSMEEQEAARARIRAKIGHNKRITDEDMNNL